MKTFAGRSVFVTGHTGFKGSWLTLWLNRLGAKVTGYAMAPDTDPSHFSLAQVQESCAKHWEGDIRDDETLHRAIRGAEPDVIFHLAAQPLVRESYREPVYTFDVNVMGTCRLLDCVRRLNRPCVIIVVTSDKCYQNDGSGDPYTERDRMGGHDPYSASKGACELITASYRNSYFDPNRIAQHGVKLASGRAGNVIGGGDWAADRIVTDIYASLAEGRAVAVRNPTAIRPWQHVLDPLAGYMTLAATLLESENPELCSAWNFGPRAESEISVRDVVELFIQCWGTGVWEDKSDAAAPHEAAILRLSIDKAVSNLDWQPRWNVQQAIEKTAAWYKNYTRGGEVLETTMADIADYESTMLETAKT